MLKYNKLPTMAVVDGQIVEKWKSVKTYSKAGFVVCTLSILSACTYFVKINYEIEFEKKLKYEQTIDSVMTTGESTLFSSAITKIITKDGLVEERIAASYAKWILESAARHKVDPILILAVMSIESRFDYSVISSGNAIGLMQVIHSWHKEKTSKTALFDPKNNIDVGTRIIAEYKNKSSTDTEMLLRYNGTLAKGSVYAVKVLSKRSEYLKKVFAEITT